MNRDEKIILPAAGVDGNAGELPPEKEIRYKPVQERVRAVEKKGE